MLDEKYRKEELQYFCGNPEIFATSENSLVLQHRLIFQMQSTKENERWRGASGLRRLFPFGRTHSTEAPIDSTDVEPAVSDSSDSASAAADAPVGEAAAPANPVSASTIVVVVLADRINQPPE